MGGKAPKSIMTDQDGAMRSAIAQVFKHANHRNCVFHIKNKAELKCGRCFDTKEGLQKEFNGIIDNSLTINEFEIDWRAMIEKHEVQHIKYFEDIFRTRNRWVPV
uniref:MULE transposase domain-containing protein n=1 Tax=Arundo donax TaxID=35708 RepID=A0A0A9FJK3_ARUDO